MSGIGTWVEQLILDIGWAGTSLLDDYCTKYNLDYSGGFKLALKPVFEELLKSLNIPVEFNWEGYSLDAIFCNDMVEFTSDTKLEIWKEMHKANDFHHALCIRTPANKNAKCYNCGHCDTPKERLQVCKREIDSSKHSIEDVMNSLSTSKCKTITRFVVAQNKFYDFYSKEMLSHYITSQFLRRSDKLADAFYKVGATTVQWASGLDQKDFFGGTWVYTVEWKTNIFSKDIKDLVEEVNKSLRTCKVMAVYDSIPEQKLTTNTLVTYKVNFPKNSLLEIQNRVMNFDWQVKIAVKDNMAMGFEQVDFSDYKKKLLLDMTKEGPVMLMTIPAKMNPYLVIGSIMKKGLDASYTDYRVSIVDTMIPMESHDKNGEAVCYSLNRDKIYAEGPTTLNRKILYKLKQG